MRRTTARNFSQKCALLIVRGARSFSGQGRRIARKGHPGRREKIAAIAGKRHFAVFCSFLLLLILAQLKHLKFGALLTQDKKFVILF